MNTVVLNMKTLETVEFRINKDTGEIIIWSSNPNDTDETCIVTTYENMHKIISERKRKIGKKESRSTVISRAT